MNTITTYFASIFASLKLITCHGQVSQ